MENHAITYKFIAFLSVMTFSICLEAGANELNKQMIEKAAGTQASISGNAIRIGWTRHDVKVRVDGMLFPPEAGLGSWAAFQSLDKSEEAMVMGDTVVFQDEVDAAMDAAFAHGLTVTALHNHFFYDEPKVYFMHIGGHGSATELATAVKAVWDAIKKVRTKNPEPAGKFAGLPPKSNGQINAKRIQEITGLDPTTKSGGVIKISSDRTATMDGAKIGGNMGLASWAAFTGVNELAVMDGDLIMTADEAQPVLKALRRSGLHVVALHNHMIGEQPAFVFTHFWGKDSITALARGFKAALDELQQ